MNEVLLPVRFRLNGQDYPHTDGHLDTCVKVRELSWLPGGTKDKILGKNALTLMGRELP